MNEKLLNELINKEIESAELYLDFENLFDKQIDDEETEENEEV